MADDCAPGVAGGIMGNGVGERVFAKGFNGWGEVEFTIPVAGSAPRGSRLGAGGGGGAAGTNLARLARPGFSSSLLERNLS